MSDFQTTVDMNVNYEDEKKEEIVGLDDDTETFQLKDKDGYTVELSRKYASISNLLKTMFESPQSESDEIEITSVKPETLKKVVDYINHHKGVEPPIIEKPLKSTNMKDVCKDSWDADFIDNIGQNQKDLHDLIMAANYFHIPSLLHLGSAKVASLIKGKPLDKIKEILSVIPDSSHTIEEKKD